MKKLISLVLFSAILLATAPAISATEAKVPIVVEAQKLVYNDKKKMAIYIGSVVAQHGTTIITGDKLIIYFDPTGKHIRKIVVKGNVHIKDPRGEGWCEELFYYPIEEKLVLIGNAKLKQKDNVIIGDKIVAYKSGKVEVEGIKQKVKTVIYPERRTIGKNK